MLDAFTHSIRVKDLNVLFKIGFHISEMFTFGGLLKLLFLCKHNLTLCKKYTQPLQTSLILNVYLLTSKDLLYSAGAISPAGAVIHRVPV